jgi:predicted Co/Zn/Cd cation transporter (cation efflux family)
MTQWRGTTVLCLALLVGVIVAFLVAGPPSGDVPSLSPSPTPS